MWDDAHLVDSLLSIAGVKTHGRDPLYLTLCFEGKHPFSKLIGRNDIIDLHASDCSGAKEIRSICL